jgi:hypothetical protein
MSKFNIEVTGGTSVRLPVGGKYCDRDIVVTAIGSASAPVIQHLEVTQNGTYTAQDGVDGYSPVTVNVPIPDGYIKPNGILEVTENGVHDVQPYASVSVNVPTTGGGSGGESDVLVGLFNKTITSLTIPYGVTTIPDNMCKSIRSLTELSIPDSVTQIGEYAFSSTGIGVLTIPPSVSRFGSYVFMSCESLTKVVFPSIVQGFTSSDGKYMFQNCNTLVDVTLPDNLPRIPNGMFYDCDALTSINIPNTVTYLGDFCFYRTALTELDIPASVNKIGKQIVYNASSLTKITFRGTPTTVHTTAFQNANNLKTINVPWAEGTVANAPWGATKATINYNYTGE